ncbi:hypothetical protein [Actinocrispum sp. NPDC049592]|uniref:hypothetical protein n=1 Tax=Actinocrispum sp. NPDC049592 TaxID=3154835 RepID=UPI0034136887
MTARPEPTRDLGPFQDIWDAWDEAHQQVTAKPLKHFEAAAGHQFTELRAHLASGDRDAAANEAIDVISIGLNVLRWLDYRPDEIAAAARARAGRRMRGRTLAILEKYERLYGV